ncbi:MAG: hypothetical protein J6W00_13505 [Lentisphaeria bacterium]|nr:hypothetical protein [Lentisphaeria bacterium]
MKFFTTLAAVFGCMLMLCGAPKLMTLESGKYKVVFRDMPHRWSIIQIFCDGVELGTPTGYYSNVMSPQSGKYIGAGHTEGGLEEFLEGTVSVDGGEAVAVNEGVFKGEKVVFKKTSMLANIKLSCTYTLTPEGLRADKQFTALKDQPVHQFYMWQFCWNKNTTDYLFIRKDGSVGKGKFINDNKMRVYGENEAYFFSQYLPAAKYATVNFFPDFGKFTGKNLLWDVGKAYHKYYFWLDLPKMVKAGYTSPVMSMIARAFPAADLAEWETKAKAEAAALLKQYPFAPTKVETAEGLTLEPSDKFQVVKTALPVELNSSYSVQFEVCKNAGISKTASDSQILVGYYDKARKFHILAAFAGNIKGDGEFHSIKGGFKTPAEKNTIYLYVYNSRSTGSVIVRNLKLEKF